MSTPHVSLSFATRWRRPWQAMTSVFVGAASLSAALLVAGADCTGGEEDAFCFLCNQAISLTVTDAQTGAVLTDYHVELILDEEPLGFVSNCESDVRTTDECTFGDVLGIYHLVVSAEGYKTRESIVRVAGFPGDTCNRACISPLLTVVPLEPLVSAP